MTVRRFLAVAAAAVLIGAQTSAAWAHGVAAYRGGAQAARVTVVGHRHRHAGKRETGIFADENTPLDLGAKGAKQASSGSTVGGGSILRTIGGLLLVIGAIYGVAWVLRRVKRSREDQASGRGLQSIATLPLGSGRSLHLVRAGSDVILVGSSEHGVAPIHRYTEEEALANGVLYQPGQDALLRETAATLAPDGTPLGDAVHDQWRTLDGAGASAGTPNIVDALRRLTVRS